MKIHAIDVLIFRVLGWVFLLPVVCGSVYSILSLLTMIWFRIRAKSSPAADQVSWKPVSILKPVYGLEKNLPENLRSTCIQDYPVFQVVFSVQDPSDPAIPLLRQMQQEFGEDRVTVAIDNQRCGSNGKINNMLGGLPHARHDLLVISDSDVRLKPDYLKAIVSPLDDPSNGAVCTLYKAICADTWYEKLELLTLNAEFMANVVFAHVTGVSRFCLGASIALHRSTLDAIGGLAALGDYLVEDYELGRRIWNSGKTVAVVPYLVDTMVDLRSPGQWWSHLVYWDQNTRAARPFAFFATAIIRSIPFALLYCLVQMGSITSLGVLATAVLLRMLTSAMILGWGFQDKEGLHCLWMLPFRDIIALASWAMAHIKRTTIWRGTEFVLTNDGRLAAREAKQ